MRVGHSFILSLETDWETTLLGHQVELEWRLNVFPSNSQVLVLNFIAPKYAFYSLFYNSRLHVIFHEWSRFVFVASAMFHALDLGFWVFSETFRVFEIFWDFCESFGLGVVYWMLYDHALHSISIFTMFHAFRCVFDCWKLCAARFGLGWTYDAIIFSTSHIHAYFMHTYPFFSFFILYCDYVLFFFSLSLSLSNKLHMAPKQKSTSTWNPFCSGSSSSTDLPPLHVRFSDEKA